MQQVISFQIPKTFTFPQKINALEMKWLIMPPPPPCNRNCYAIPLYLVTPHPFTIIFFYKELEAWFTWKKVYFPKNSK